MNAPGCYDSDSESAAEDLCDEWISAFGHGVSCCCIQLGVLYIIYQVFFWNELENFGMSKLSVYRSRIFLDLRQVQRM